MGEKQEKTEWHRITFYRKLAEIVGEYLKKGQPIYVEGRIETKKWTDKAGVERYTTEIIASDMKMLGSKDRGDSAPAPKASEDKATAKAPSKVSAGFEDMDDDIPF